MGKELTHSEAYAELRNMQPVIIKSVVDYIYKKGDPSDTFIHTQGNSDSHILLGVGPYSIILELTVKPFVQAIFMKTIIDDVEIEQLGLICYINQRVIGIKKAELNYTNFGTEYCNGLMKFLSEIEEDELKEIEARKLPERP